MAAMNDEFDNPQPEAIAADRDLVIFIDATATSGEGIAFVSISRIGSDVETVTSEERGGDTSVLLSTKLAR